jgi:leucyl-tRNA synthetase
VVNPDEIVREFGADTIRLYEMFMGPLEDQKPWDTKGAVGVRRFLDKVWSVKDKIGDVDNPDCVHLLHQTIKKVTEDLAAMKFNTAVSQMMIFVNALGEAELVPRAVYETFLVLLSPFAPHLCEELWEQTGHATSIFSESWPKWNERLVKDELVAVAIQVNGKLRGTMSVSPDLSEAEALARARSQANVEKHLAGKEVVKAVYIPGRLINLVVK